MSRIVTGDVISVSESRRLPLPPADLPRDERFRFGSFDAMSLALTSVFASALTPGMVYSSGLAAIRSRTSSSRSAW